ncbi:hypothetical protein EQ500_01280, partial [Lactobacillus sp. XV13L]|nr:hypothetical protein [Lactobacillus sp. XV13L]
MQRRHQQTSNHNWLYLIIVIVLGIIIYGAFKLGQQTTAPKASPSTPNTRAHHPRRPHFANRQTPKTHNSPNSEPESTRDYQSTQAIGPYSISTQELNAHPFHYDHGNLDTGFRLQLDNQSGQGQIILFNYDSNIQNQYPVHYQESATKTLKLQNSAEFLTVKVNTALVFDEQPQKVYYAFKNRFHLASVAIP